MTEIRNRVSRMSVVNPLSIKWRYCFCGAMGLFLYDLGIQGSDSLIL